MIKRRAESLSWCHSFFCFFFCRYDLRKALSDRYETLLALCSGLFEHLSLYFISIKAHFSCVMYSLRFTPVSLLLVNRHLIGSWFVNFNWALNKSSFHLRRVERFPISSVNFVLLPELLHWFLLPYDQLDKYKPWAIIQRLLLKFLLVGLKVVFIFTVSNL